MTVGDPSVGPARRYGGLSAEERTQRRRDQFLAAGLEVFGTVGYRRATAREVCRLAGLTDRYFHESFASMEDLLVAVYLFHSNELSDVLATTYAERAGAPLPEVVHALLDTFFTFARERRRARVLWHEVLGVSPAVDAMYIGRLEVYIDFVDAVMLGVPEAAGAISAVTPEERRVIATALVGAIDNLTRMWTMSDYATPQATVVRGLALVLLTLATTAPGARKLLDELAAPDDL